MREHVPAHYLQPCGAPKHSWGLRIRRTLWALAMVGLATCDGSGDAPGTLADAGNDVDPVVDAAVDAAMPMEDAYVPPDDAAPVGPPARVLYTPDRRHSPITQDIVDRMSAVKGTSRQEQVFAKIGDSMTRATEFVRCFDGGPVDLADRVALRPTIDYYLQGNALGRTPYRRESLAANNGATTESTLAGDPSQLTQELAAIQPRLGVIMLGTNDVRRGRSLDAFASELWSMIDQMLAAGTLPVMSSIPANASDAWADVQIPRFNLAIRGIAQGRQVPFVDLHRALNPLPNRGLGADGVHLSVDAGGACILTSSGLQSGYNTRNLVTIESLMRVRAGLAGTPSDASAPALVGNGRAADPYVVSWPFADIGDTRDGEALVANHGCASRPQNGKEVVYEVNLPSQVRLHAQVIQRAGSAADVDVHVVAGGQCRGSGDDSVIVTVGPGPVQIIVDTPEAASEGEYLLVIGPRVNPPS
jgi:hypothetical protein